MMGSPKLIDRHGPFLRKWCRSIKSIGNTSSAAKISLEALADFAFNKPYLVDGMQGIESQAVEGQKTAGLYQKTWDEILDSRRALAGAKAAQVVLFSVPRLEGKEDANKKKRDLARSA